LLKPPDVLHIFCVLGHIGGIEFPFIISGGDMEQVLSPGERALIDSVLSAFPSEPMTDAEFEAARRMRSNEVSIDDVIAHAKNNMPGE
jgi:hypothetical protein